MRRGCSRGDDDGGDDDDAGDDDGGDDDGYDGYADYGNDSLSCTICIGVRNS